MKKRNLCLLPLIKRSKGSQHPFSFFFLSVFSFDFGLQHLLCSLITSFVFKMSCKLLVTLFLSSHQVGLPHSLRASRTSRGACRNFFFFGFFNLTLRKLSIDTSQLLQLKDSRPFLFLNSCPKLLFLFLVPLHLICIHRME